MAQELSFKFKADIDLDVIVKKFNVLLTELKSSLDKFGNTISLLDEAKIKKEMDSIKISYDTLGDKARKAGSEADVLANGLEKAAKSGTLLSKAFQFNQMAQSVNMVVGALDKFVQPFVELDKQVKNIGTLGVKNFEEFASLATQLSKTVPDSAANIALGVYQAVSAGISGTNQEIIKFTETAAKVAVAGVATTEQAVNGLTSVLNAYGLKASEVSGVSDGFFAAIKLGKTTFNELNGALANVIPSASAAGVNFDEVVALIAQMTALGVPTAQATTQIRSALIELQKPTGQLEAFMKKLGLSAQDMQEKLSNQGLIATLQELEKSATAQGKPFNLLFGSMEAGSAAALLTGKNAERATQTLASVREEIEKGVSTEAYDVAAQSIDVKTKIFLNKVQAGFSQFFDTIGTGAVTALNTISQLGPAMSSFAGFSQILPTSKMLEGIKGIPKAFNSALPAVSGFSASISKLIPGIASIGVVAPTAFGAAGAAGTASGTATSAAWITVLAPIAAVIAAIAAVGAIFLYLYNNVEGFRNLINGVWEVAEYGFTRLWDILKRVADMYLSMSSAFFEGVLLPFRLAIDVIAGLVSALTGLSGEAITVEDVINALGWAFDFVTTQLTVMKAVIDGFVAGIKSITGSVSTIIKSILSGNISGAIQAFGNAGSDAGKAMKDGMDASWRDANFDEWTKKLEKKFADGIKINAKIQEIEGIDSLLANYQDTTLQIKTLKAKPESDLTVDERNQLQMLEKQAQQTADAIGKIVPEARENFRMITDESGNLVKVYDINIDKTKELADEREKAYKQQQLDDQAAYTQGLTNQSVTLADQTKKLKEAEEAAKKLYAEGNKDAFALQRKKVIALKDGIQATRDSMVDSFTKGAKAGLLTKDATEKIGTQLGLNNQSIDDAKNQQGAFTAEVEETDEAVKSLGDSFSDAMNKAKQGQSEAIGALAELARQLKNNEITREQYDENRKKALVDGKNAVKEVLYLTELEKQAKRDLGIVEGQRAKTTATSLQNAKKLFDTEKKSITNALEQKRIIAETVRLESGREKTIIDDIAAQKDAIKALQQEKDVLQEIYKLKLDANGVVIDVGIKLGKDEKKSEVINDINNQITQLNNAIAKEKNKDIELNLKAKLEDEEFLKKLDELALSELRYEIELGIKVPEDLVAKLKENQAEITKTIVEEQKTIDTLLSELGSEKGENQLTAERRAEIESEIKDRKSKLVDLKKTELDGRKEINSEEKAIRTKRMQDLQTQHNEEMQLIEKRKQAELELNKAIIGSSSGALDRVADIKQENDIKKLEEMKEAEIITEVEYNKRKEDLEREHQNNKKAIQDAARGAEIEAQRQHDIALLTEQRAREQAILDAIDPKDTKAIEAQRAKLEGMDKVIAEKGDILLASAEALQGSIADIFVNLFDGGEAMKDSARTMLANMGGILKAAASAAVSKLIIDSLFTSTTGFWAVLTIPMIKGLVSAAMNTILGPALSALSSFHTGGRVDSPTVAIVGDASQGRPGNDTEWILRDDHLWLIVTEAVRQQEHHLINAVKLLSLDLSQEMQKMANNLDLTAIMGLMETDVTVEKHLRQLEIVNKGLSRINEGVNSLEKSLNTQLSPDKTIKLLSEMSKMMKIQVDYQTEVTDADEYLQQYGQQELKIRSFASGSGFLTKPELALVGDAGNNNPEIVLNNPQLQALISEASKSGNEMLIRKMDQLINVVESLDFDVYLNSQTVTDEVNRENNRRKRRSTIS